MKALCIGDYPNDLKRVCLFKEKGLVTIIFDSVQIILIIDGKGDIAC